MHVIVPMVTCVPYHVIDSMVKHAHTMYHMSSIQWSHVPHHIINSMVIHTPCTTLCHRSNGTTLLIHVIDPMVPQHVPHHASDLMVTHALIMYSMSSIQVPRQTMQW